MWRNSLHAGDAARCDAAERQVVRRLDRVCGQLELGTTDSGGKQPWQFNRPGAGQVAFVGDYVPPTRDRREKSANCHGGRSRLYRRHAESEETTWPSFHARPPVCLPGAIKDPPRIRRRQTSRHSGRRRRALRNRGPYHPRLNREHVFRIGRSSRRTALHSFVTTDSNRTLKAGSSCAQGHCHRRGVHRQEGELFAPTLSFPTSRNGRYAQIPAH